MMDTSVMQERIGQLCHQFKLPTMGTQSVARFTAAGHGEALPTFLEVLEQEADDRRQRRIDRLRKMSRLPSGKTWETFEHDRMPLSLRQQLDQLANGDFTEHGVNVLAFGLPGTGKTHALCAVGALPHLNRYPTRVIASHTMLPKSGRQSVAGGISRMAKQELLATIRDRYRESSKKDKGRILDEFIAVTGHHRKHGIRLLGQSGDAGEKLSMIKGRRIYDEAVREAVILAWEATDRICGKRLKAALPHLVESMERHGHLDAGPRSAGAAAGRQRGHLGPAAQTGS